MATLYIFGDESGTMPINDTDKPFVAATVAVLDNPPVLIPGSDDDSKMVEIFSNLNIIPYITVVKPFPGYGNTLKAKHGKMQVMARATRLVNGANARYLNENGFDIRNWIWCHAMGQGIANAVLHTVSTSSIDVVRVLLDRKTMSPSMRVFFKEMVVNHVGNWTKEFVAKYRMAYPSEVSLWEDRARFSSKSVILNWSDESKELEKQFGLKLADRLARKIYQAQMTGQPGIESMFKAAGFDNIVIDISKLVIRLDRRVVDNFKRNTRLPEPRDH